MVEQSTRMSEPPSPEAESARPLLKVRGLTKQFGHIRALRGADLDVDAGEVVGLVGDNGAGKSTITKILSGILNADAGDIILDGRAVRFPSPRAAREHGIETVYQDLALAADLDAVANLFLGRELYRRGAPGVLDEPAMHRRALALFDELGIRLQSISTPVFRLSGGQRQGIAVARAIAWSTRLIIMDEPTAALGPEQSERVLMLIRRMKQRGIAVLLISHNLRDVCAVADRIQVFQLGQRVAILPGGIDAGAVLTAMSGAVGTAGSRLPEAQLPRAQLSGAQLPGERLQ
jgi:simple sugar transport system ATP-binding protein